VFEEPKSKRAPLGIGSQWNGVKNGRPAGHDCDVVELKMMSVLTLEEARMLRGHQSGLDQTLPTEIETDRRSKYKNHCRGVQTKRKQLIQSWPRFQTVLAETLTETNISSELVQRREGTYDLKVEKSMQNFFRGRRNEINIF